MPLFLRCPSCLAILSTDCFYRDRSRPSGRRPYCKTCDKIRRSAHYHATIAASRAYHRNYQRRRRELNQ